MESNIPYINVDAVRSDGRPNEQRSHLDQRFQNHSGQLKK